MAQPFLHTSTHSSRVNDASGQHLSSVKESSRLFSAKPKKPSHSLKQYDVVPSSTSDHYHDPRPVPSRAKKHTGKSKHKSRSRYLPSSSEEDQSSELRHRSPKPTLIKTILNMTQILLTTGKLLCLTSPLSMQRRWIPSGISSNFQTLETLYPGLLLRSWALMMRKADRSSDQEALPLCCL